METRPLKQSVKNGKVYCAVAFVPLYNRKFQLLVYFVQRRMGSKLSYC